MAVRRSATDAYVAPSSAPAATELDALARMSQLVPDTKLLEMSALSAPEAATVSAAVIVGVLSSEKLGVKPIEVG